jgi:hypothetical protein
MKMTTYHRPLVFDQRVPNRIQNSELRIQNAGIRRGDSGVPGLAFSDLGFRNWDFGFPARGSGPEVIWKRMLPRLKREN